MTRGLPLGRSIGFRTTVSRIEESVADPDPQEIRGRPCLKKKKKLGGPSAPPPLDPPPRMKPL